MSLTALLLSWAALALVAVMSPGPDVLLVAGHSARNGLRAGLSAVGGITVGGLWYMALCGFGFLSVLNASPTLFMIVKFGGALYLAYLGVKLIRGAINPPEVSADHAVSLGAPFRQGLVTNALNPKIALFYLAVLPQFVGTGPHAPLLGVLLIAIHYMIGALWLGFLAWGASRAGTAVRGGSAMRWVEGILGAAFIGLAGKLVVSRS
jgi:threonine/homoserine/homoserine lactone efflux protein